MAKTTKTLTKLAEILIVTVGIFACSNLTLYEKDKKVGVSLYQEAKYFAYNHDDFQYINLTVTDLMRVAFARDELPTFYKRMDIKVMSSFLKQFQNISVEQDSWYKNSKLSSEMKQLLKTKLRCLTMPNKNGQTGKILCPENLNRLSQTEYGIEVFVLSQLYSVSTTLGTTHHQRKPVLNVRHPSGKYYVAGQAIGFFGEATFVPEHSKEITCQGLKKKVMVGKVKMVDNQFITSLPDSSVSNLMNIIYVSTKWRSFASLCAYNGKYGWNGNAELLVRIDGYWFKVVRSILIQALLVLGSILLASWSSSIPLNAALSRLGVGNIIAIQAIIGEVLCGCACISICRKLEGKQLYNAESSIFYFLYLGKVTFSFISYRMKLKVYSSTWRLAKFDHAWILNEICFFALTFTAFNKKTLPSIGDTCGTEYIDCDALEDYASYIILGVLPVTFALLLDFGFWMMKPKLTPENEDGVKLNYFEAECITYPSDVVIPDIDRFELNNTLDKISSGDGEKNEKMTPYDTIVWHGFALTNQNMAIRLKDWWLVLFRSLSPSFLWKTIFPITVIIWNLDKSNKVTKANRIFLNNLPASSIFGSGKPLP